MFRIYRDVRFSKDKTPYKTQAAVQFRHRAAFCGRPASRSTLADRGFYLQEALAPFLG